MGEYLMIGFAVVIVGMSYIAIWALAGLFGYKSGHDKGWADGRSAMLRQIDDHGIDCVKRVHGER